MRKKFFFIAVSAIVAVSAGIFAYLNSESKSDDMFSANVEALADNEGGETVKCYCKTRVTRPNVCTVQGSGGYCGGDPCSNHDGNCR